ncbi:hypothetical protein HMPREF9436_01099 [Faecalibacterium cf. prausnitzii KLE1255]|uniref:Uncharacterized protein n=1 Tax=Faecalibacterium cf. prausnitzii KLE1255 TaxID=748224 RepID=E2ZHF9_9FIRM|nr:hypothetical protein HMPREF9436_01099 [Faecalibacterium cf. prausnitzii KLE1255]
MSFGYLIRGIEIKKRNKKELLHSVCAAALFFACGGLDKNDIK